MDPRAARERADSLVADAETLWAEFAGEVAKFGPVRRTPHGLAIQEADGPTYTFAFGPEQLRRLLVHDVATQLLKGRRHKPLRALPQWFLDDVYETIGLSGEHDGHFVIMRLVGPLTYSLDPDRVVEPEPQPIDYSQGSGKWYYFSDRPEPVPGSATD